MAVVIVHSLILFIFLLTAVNCTEPEPRSTLQLFHAKTAPLTSWDHDTVLQSHSKDEARLKYLARKSAPIASGRQQVVQSPTYVVRASVGTPPQSFLMALDTTSDTSWIPCGGCQGCPSTVFSSEKSTSYKILGCQDLHCQQARSSVCASGSCSLNVTYGGSIISANLSQDIVNLAGDDIPDYTFGCIQKVTAGTSAPPAQGLLGLGRGPLSLLSQTQSLYQSTFSYCLPNYKALNFSGSLWLGQVGQPKKIKYTPLLNNPRRSSLYYVNLVAIKVGRRIVDIPTTALAFNSSTGAGTIIDSGTMFTRLVQPAYEAVRNEFRRRMDPTANVTTLGGFDTCYTVPITIPSIVLMFEGNLNVSLPQDNFLIRSTSGTISCLAMSASPILNVIASFQQQNHRYVFDVPNNRLGIARQACS